jgi:predicted Zn-dependent protease
LVGGKNGATRAILLAFALSAAAAAAAQTPDRAARRGTAQQMMQAGRYDEAAVIYRELLKTTPTDSGLLLDLAEADLAAGHLVEAAEDAGKATIAAPTLPAAWYELGRTYEAIAKAARSTFEARPEDAAWRQLIAADRLLAGDQLTYAFVTYRAVLQQLPSMVTIRDSIATIYESSGHADWAAEERTLASNAPVDCETRTVLCQFRKREFAAALTASLRSQDAESRYLGGRAADELARAAYKRLDDLPDSSERHIARAATLAGVQRRYTDAIVELKAALKLTPGNRVLIFELATLEFEARDYDQAIAVLTPLLRASPDDPRLLRLLGLSLAELRRVDEAIPVLQRVAASTSADPQVRLALGLAHLQKGNYANAIPMLEPQIAGDTDGSLHIQLARAYTGMGQREKSAALLEQGQALQRQAYEQRAADAQQQILPPAR